MRSVSAALLRTTARQAQDSDDVGTVSLTSCTGKETSCAVARSQAIDRTKDTTEGQLSGPVLEMQDTRPVPPARTQATVSSRPASASGSGP